MIGFWCVSSVVLWTTNLDFKSAAEFAGYSLLTATYTQFPGMYTKLKLMQSYTTTLQSSHNKGPERW